MYIVYVKATFNPLQGFALAIFTILYMGVCAQQHRIVTGKYNSSSCVIFRGGNKYLHKLNFGQLYINCTLIVLDMLLRLTSTVCSFLKSICVFVCVFNCIFDSYVYSSPHHSMVYKSSSNNITTYCNINKRYEASGVLAIGCMIYCFVNLLPGIS